ncbi:N-acetylglucosamine-6-phosphate deacetylase [Evansella cellulosilytica]|uniref:N-acetylglucosamine-6-phosphate deacetylase n=1 Tax=Evansella cellulosilytica (strain ATCC 21833 / DSM 2522 / FERM P-1141 / JCM 9156 / N-4) TaxID=649639 RepID=E6TT29_EVAC2|nr:N-acetylglucosamine-6-phosphate deacetylase [Evansella cellulosilytica]ADU31937.1 N-acetylglucosamine-6-phosphate deacetylase [Evansella cellulosilytica DSM 2522]
MKDQYLFIKNIQIYMETSTVPDGCLLIKNNQIERIGMSNDFTNMEEVETIDGQGLHAIPGFIDGHIHGVNGTDVMDGTPEALANMCETLPKEGTTSFLATTITQSTENIEKALKNVARYENKSGTAELIGVHLEGPYIEKKKAGAQPPMYTVPPNILQFKHWQALSGNAIKTVTMAPEKDTDGSFIQYLYEQGINVSAGHTEAGIADMKKALKHGVKQVTHLCNAMTGLHHRDIGVVGAAFLFDELKCELIVDGYHVSKDMVHLIYKNVGVDRIMLVTDSIRAKCMQPGKYELGGQQVVVDDEVAALADGRLAGSILKLIDGAKNMVEYSGASIEELVKMTALNPAKQLNIFDRKGSLAVGKDADILLIDDDLALKYTICRGKVAFKEEVKSGASNG